MFARATTINDAIDEVRLLAAALPGAFDVDVIDHDDVSVITARGVLISSGCEVEVDLRIAERDDRVEVPTYRISVRHRGTLVWRADRHPGHEASAPMDGRLEHRHLVTNGVEARVPDSPQTLESIRRDLISTNLERSASL